MKNASIAEENKIANTEFRKFSTIFISGTIHISGREIILQPEQRTGSSRTEQCELNM